MSGRAALLATALALALGALGALVPAAARAQEPATAFAADASQLGVISLHFWGAQGATVQYFERIGDRLDRLGKAKAAPGAVTTLKDAATWSCERLERTFSARTTLPDGTLTTAEYGVRTASCATRFALTVPRRAALDSRPRVRVVDRWNLGEIGPQLCVAAPRARSTCRRLAFARAVAVATRRFRATRRGRWRVELRIRGHRVRRYVAVGKGTAVAAAPPTVLATGDSTMQGIDSFLGDELGDDATLQSDVQLGSAISRTRYWLDHAASQVRTWRPRVSVMSVGAAYDAFPLRAADGTEAECCDEPWTLAYAERVRAIMRTYLRAGRGRVFWLTPPLPRDPLRLKITTAIDAAIEAAAQGLAGVRVIRVDELFAPAGVYSETIRYRGRDVRVRDADGVHLNISGTAILAQLLAPAIRTALAETAPKR